MAANLQFAESLRQSIQHCKLDLLGRVDTSDGIGRISNFFGELEAAVSVLDTKQSSWREIFDRAKISTGKRDGRKVHAKDSRQNNSPPEYKAKTCHVEKNDKDASKPVARHFNLPNHSKKHMAICGLSLHLGTTESHKNLEQKFIFQIGTLNPHGINKRFSFN